MEPNWSTDSISSEAGCRSSSTHKPSSFAPYIDAGGSSSSTYVAYPPYNYGPPTFEFDLYHSSSSYAIDYSDFAPYTHDVYASVVVQLGILFSSLLIVPHILNF